MVVEREARPALSFELQQVLPFSLTKEFYEVAQRRGVHASVYPALRPSLQRVWLRDVQILNDYLRTGLTYWEVGKRHMHSGDGSVDKNYLSKATHEIVKQTARVIYEGSPQGMRAYYGPFEGFTFRKLLSDESRRRLGRSKSKYKNKVLSLAADGLSPKQIQLQTGLRESQVKGVIYQSRRNGELEGSRTQKAAELSWALANSPESFEERQILLNKVTNDFYRKHKSLFERLRTFAKTTGIPIKRGKTAEYVSMLKSFGIPVGINTGKDCTSKTFMLKSDYHRFLIALTRNRNGVPT